MKQQVWQWAKKSLAPFLVEVLKDSIRKSVEMEVENQMRARAISEEP